MAIGSDETSVQSTSRTVRRPLVHKAAAATPRGLIIGSESRRRRGSVGLALLGSDLVSALAAVSLVGSLSGVSATRAALLALPLLMASFWVAGLYGGLCRNPFERLRGRVLGLLAFTGAFLIVHGETWQLGAWLVAACQAVLLLLIGFYAETLVRDVLVRRNLWGAATAFVGGGPAIEQACRLFSAMPELGLRPVGRLDNGDGSAPAANDGSLPMLGLVDDLPYMIRANLELIVAATTEDFTRASTAARRAVDPPRILLLETEPRPCPWPQVSPLGPSFISLAVGRDPNAPCNKVIKRMIDLAIAVPAMLVISPLIGALALAIKLSDPGPAFYAQARLGHYRRSFRFTKLRSMLCDAESRLQHHLSNNAAARVEWDRFCKLSHDPRVLPYIGDFIRRTSLDELPQLWHVIRGEMSLVGPRPFPAYHAERFDREFQALRASVPPGLTGLWQVSSRSDGDLDVQKSQDLYYIRNWSIWLDLYVLLQTLPAVIRARGAR